MSFFGKIILAVLFIVSISIAVFVIVNYQKEDVENIVEEPQIIEEINKDPQVSVIGRSLEGRVIENYSFGDGDKNLIFVGGIHGGYEWNTTSLAYKFIDYLEENPEIIPDNVEINVIPILNPDGLYKVILKEGRFVIASVTKDEEILASGRFNSRKIDLNRNFDCKWNSTSTWRGNTVSAGNNAFSEPEALALKNFISTNTPEAVIFWHSQGNAVYASECENGILPETLDLMNAYSNSSGYKSFESFDAYPITGDAEGWLASIGIPAITVELSTHETIDWQQNLSGVKSLLEYYKVN